MQAGRRISIVLAPLLFAIYPVVSVFSHNREHLRLEQIVAPLFAYLVLGVVLQCVIFILTRHGEFSSFLAAVYLFAFSSHGYIAALLGSICKFLSYDKILLPIVLLVLALITHLAWKRRAFLALSLRFALCIGSVLLLVPCLQYVLARGWRTGPGWTETATVSAPQPKPAQVTGVLPDIYYIVPDRYANERILREEFGFDNAPFLDKLRARGFYVVPEPYANYPKTAFSLAATLNMSHMLDLASSVGPTFQSWLPLYDLIGQNRVISELKGRGYSYVHFGTWWMGTRRNPRADLNIDAISLSELWTILYQNTMAYPVGRILKWPGFGGDARLFQWKRMRHQLARLERMGKEPGPKFVFAHLIIPHPPYVFSADGSYRDLDTEEQGGDREGYLGQTKFINDRLTAVIDAILVTSAIDPVIIVQSDEGPFPAGYDDDQVNYNWRQARPRDLRIKFGIISAIRLPGLKDGLYPGITPVNTFRLIFNHLFHAGLEMLPDRSYAFTDLNSRYELFDVTEKLGRRLKAEEKQAED